MSERVCMWCLGTFPEHMIHNGLCPDCQDDTAIGPVTSTDRCPLRGGV
jgi:hypothetical protein